MPQPSSERPIARDCGLRTNLSGMEDPCTQSKAHAPPAQGRSNTLPHSPWAIRSIARSNSPVGSDA
jgi:hypothetical protein